jgi:hypothetical protein
VKKYPLWTLALTLGLPLAGWAQGAPGETVVAQAVGDQQPGVVAFYDSADGKTSGLDNSMSQKVASALAGAQYMLTDAGHLVVMPAHASGSSAQPVLPVANDVDVSGNQGTYYMVHSRTSSGFLDGAVSRDLQNPSASYVILDLVLFDQQGDSESIHIEQNLTWATSPAAGTNPGSGSNSGSNNSVGGTNPLGGSNPIDGGSNPGDGGTPLGGSSPGSGDPTGGTGPTIF